MSDYNHDLMQIEDFAKQNKFSKIKGLLVHDELNSELLAYDKTARRNKMIMQTTGRAALLLGFVAVLGIIIELLVPGLDAHLRDWVVIVIEILAVITILIFLVDRLIVRSRARYVVSCFCRERLRQWHFQVFLDGAFVQAFADDSTEGTKELDARFVSFKESLRSAGGSLKSFLRTPANVANLLHTPSAYSDATTATSVFEALQRLRFEHQSQFAGRKLTSSSYSEVMALEDHYHWAENLARFALLGAFAIPVVQLVLVGLKHSGVREEFDVAHVCLSAGALALVAVSASARAYRAGMTLPEELESYEEYVGHVDTLRAILNVSSLEEKHELHTELEIESERELRRFLAMKSKATFVA